MHLPTYLPGLVQLGLAAPAYLDLRPALVALAFEAVQDLPLAPDPVACVVVAEGLLDLHALFEFWVVCGDATGGREKEEDACSELAGGGQWGRVGCRWLGPRWRWRGLCGVVGVACASLSAGSLGHERR